MLLDQTESAGWLRENSAKGKNMLIHGTNAQVCSETNYQTLLGMRRFPLLLQELWPALTIAPLSIHKLSLSLELQNEKLLFQDQVSIVRAVETNIYSAIVEWKYDNVPPDPTDNIPPSASYDTHECPRRMREAQDQIKKFLEEGIIEQYCSGVCEKPYCGDED